MALFSPLHQDTRVAQYGIIKEHRGKETSSLFEAMEQMLH